MFSVDSAIFLFRGASMAVTITALPRLRLQETKLYSSSAILLQGFRVSDGDSGEVIGRRRERVNLNNEFNLNGDC